MHFIVGMLFGRFATKSLRYKTFRSAVFTHQFEKIEKMLAFNFNVRFGGSQKSRSFFTFSARPRTSQIRDYNETKNVLQQQSTSWRSETTCNETTLQRNDRTPLKLPVRIFWTECLVVLKLFQQSHNLSHARKKHQNCASLGVLRMSMCLHQIITKTFFRSYIRKHYEAI